MKRLFPVLVALVSTLALVLVSTGPAEARKRLPSKKTWVKDTRKAMYGSRAWIDERTAAPKPTDGQLAVNLDIDNTSLATAYAPGKAVAVTLRFVRYAKAHDVAVLFNTGRLDTQLTGITESLRQAGYPVDGMCGRQKNERLAKGKQRCRADYAAQGYTLIANVGNRRTDLVGGGYERAFKLPSYGKRLG